MIIVSTEKNIIHHDIEKLQASSMYFFTFNESSLPQIIHPKWNCKVIEKSTIHIHIWLLIRIFPNHLTLTINFLLQRSVGMEDTECMNKLFKFNNSISLFIKKIKYLKWWLDKWTWKTICSSKTKWIFQYVQSLKIEDGWDISYTSSTNENL